MNGVAKGRSCGYIRRNRAGFTLVEMLIVLLIVGVLAGALLLVAWSGGAVVVAQPVEVLPVVDRDYGPTLGRLLDGASRTVDLVAYEFLAESGAVRDLAEKLGGRSAGQPPGRPPVRVRAFLEGDKKGLGARNRRTAGLLTGLGATVQPDAEDCTTHAKVVSVDGEWLLAGSTNLSNASVGANREANILIRSPALGAAFTGWFEGLLASPGVPVSSRFPVGNVTLLTDGAYFPALEEMLASATRQVDIVLYHLDVNPWRPSPVDDLAARLAALTPRVRVRVLLERSDRFAPHITAANRRAARFLAARGVEVFFDRPDRFTHAKVVVRDGEEVLLGSSNWFRPADDRSHQFNVRVARPEVAAFFAGWIDRLIDEDGEPWAELPPGQPSLSPVAPAAGSGPPPPVAGVGASEPAGGRRVPGADEGPTGEGPGPLRPARDGSPSAVEAGATPVGPASAAPTGVGE